MYQHLIEFGMVLTNTFMSNGKVWTRWKNGEPVLVDDHFRDFYVHPETGILCKTKGKPRWRRPEIEKPILIDGDKLRQIHCIEGIWYEISLREPTSDELKHKQFGKKISPRTSFALGKLIDWEPTYSN